MTPEQHALWCRLQSHPLDLPAAAQPFSLRLAKENDWAPGFTQRAMAEYLRFAFIATAGGHPVAPSDVVDQVWHLHLLHTRDYWENFCPRVLGAPLHHGPARGGREEQQKFGDWYARTLASYRRFFGEPPPDIWPEPALHPRTQRVAIDQHWVVRKPRLVLALQAAGRALWRRRFFWDHTRRSTLRPADAGGGPTAPATKPAPCSGNGVTAMLLLALCLLPSVVHAAPLAAASSFWPLDWPGPAFLVFFFWFALIVFAAAWWLRQNLGSDVPGAEHRSDLIAYDVAELANGHGQAFNAAVVHLHVHGHVVVRENAIARGTLSLPPGRPLLERAIVEGCSREGSPIATVRAAAQDSLDSVAASLVERGLQVSKQNYQHLWVMAVALLVPAIGWIKVQIGSWRGKPTDSLVIASWVSFVVALAFCARPRLSWQGRAVLRRLRSEKANLQFGRQVPPADLSLAVGLFGLDVLTNTDFEKLKRDLGRVPTGDASSSGSCGTSTCSSGGGDGGGGGGDGGGGGGCGGCGGGGGGGD